MIRIIYENRIGYIYIKDETSTGRPIYAAVQHKGTYIETMNIDTAHAYLARRS